MTLNAENERIMRLTGQLYQASKSIRILSHISWDSAVRERFFAQQARELPVVAYPAFDLEPVRTELAAVRAELAPGPVDEWLGRQCLAIERGAQLLGACGTPQFFQISAELYGTPKAVLPDQTSNSLALATELDRMIESFTHIDLGAPPPACHLAQGVAEALSAAAQSLFREEAPPVSVVDELSANALAGPNRIRLRRAACFSDKDIAQLVHHEVHIHVATSLNGLAQTRLKILGAGHPGTTRTQEGLAVFSELITGSMDLSRMRRLGDRVLAIQMAIDGADFLEVYAYFLDRSGDENQAFENARRVFRGGVVSGGAPFTKDLVYLDGLLRVHNFFRAVVIGGRADCLRLLFCGKLDIEDVPVIHHLRERGLCQPPKFLPPWAQDLRFLLCHLTYSSFLNSVDLKQIRAHYDQLLREVPPSAQLD